jgi:hypothetical protein
MRPEDCIGQIGRTLSEVTATGRVDVAGESFDALTDGSPIPAGVLVRVAGWRLVDGSRRVLVVHSQQAPAASGDDWFTRTCLTLGCVLCLLASVGSLLNMALWLLAHAGFLQVEGIPPPLIGTSVVSCIVWGVLGFFFWTGLAIVFARAMRFP